MGGAFLRTSASAVVGLIAIGSCGSVYAASPYACQFKPSKKDVARLEASIVLPDGATEFKTYTREYVGIAVAGGRKLFGYFVRPESGKTGWVRRHQSLQYVGFLSDLAHCEAVFVLYNLDTGKLQFAKCDSINENVPGIPRCPL